MFLKSLIISSENTIIREIHFRKGINLIVDETPNSGKETGNNVGKTTVLKLIDFCLGAKPNGIYLDPESKKDEYLLVKEFLKENKVLITLILKGNLDINESNEIVIERNFLDRKETIRRINGENLTEDEFEIKLSHLIFPKHQANKPSFRQIISHNIRYKEESINNTIYTLNKYTSDVEYETLYLFMFGIKFEEGNIKQEKTSKLKQEESFKARLEKKQTKTAYETALSLINNEIESLNKRKMSFNLNENFEKDLVELNSVKYQINRTSSELSNLNIRKELILEAERDLKENISDIDLQQLHLIYAQATQYASNIQKTFEELVEYHNQMITEKVKFITKELPELEKSIETKAVYLQNLLQKEKSLGLLISKSDSFEELEKLMAELNEKYQKKGEYENVITQLKEVELEINRLSKELKTIDDALFSDEFEETVKKQLNKFNQHFSTISSELYGEQYALKYDKVTKKNRTIYKFNAFNTNFSSGKKQGEISCFDIAYTLFADDEKIPCLHFLLNDKKELMHDNQLVKIADFVNNSNIQFVASILKDKLPEELNKEEYFIIKLSQQDKLFRIKE